MAFFAVFNHNSHRELCSVCFECVSERKIIAQIIMHVRECVEREMIKKMKNYLRRKKVKRASAKVLIPPTLLCCSNRLILQLSL